MDYAPLALVVYTLLFAAMFVLWWSSDDTQD